MKLFFIFLFTLALGINVGEVRKLYPNSADSKTNAEAFLNKLEDVDHNSSAVLMCYKGAALAMQAKFAKTIKEKKAKIKAGAAIIEDAIEKDNKNIEMRMIRLSIQESLPKIVGYSKDISDDRDFILNNISGTPPSLKDYILDFVMQSKSFTAAQKASLKG